MSDVDQIRAAAALAYAICGVAHDDKAANQEYADVLAASQDDIRALLADGPIPAVMTLLRLVDLAITHAATTAKTDRQKVAREIANSMLDLHAPGSPHIGLPPTT